MLRKFIKTSAIYAIPTIVSQGLSLLLVPLYTRVLVPADYGSLDLLIVFGSLVNLTIALEISQGVARFYTDEADPEQKVVYASSAFWFTVACYFVFAVVALAGSDRLAKLVMGRDDMVGAFRIGIVYIGINGVLALIQNQFRWELRATRYTTVSLLVLFSTAGSAVWFTYGLHWGLEGLLLGMMTGSVTGVAYGLWHLRNSFRLRFNASRLKEMLIFSAPLVPSGIAVFISNYIDRLMINHYLSIDEVGLYGIGFRLAGIVGVVMVGFRGALMPLIYTHYRDPDTPEQLAHIFRLFLALSLLIFSGLTLFAHDILVVMTTPVYYSAAQVVIFLVPAILLAQMYIFAPGIGITKKTYLFVWVNLGGATLNTVLNWWLIPVMGIRGAALATLLGYVSVFTTYMILSQRLYHVPHDWLRLGMATASVTGVVVLASAFSVDDSTRWALSCIALIVIGALFLLIGLVRMSEIKEMKNFLSAFIGQIFNRAKV